MKRIFIYSRRSIFSQGIQHLLEAQPDLEIVGWETDPEAAARRIQEIAPEIVLIVHRNDRDEPLAEARNFLRAALGKTRIIELNAENNQARVFWGEQCAVSELGELMRLIEESMAAFAGKMRRLE